MTHRKKKKRINKIIIIVGLFLIAFALIIWAIQPPSNDNAKNTPQADSTEVPANLADNGSLPPIDPLTGDYSGLVEDKQIIYKIIRKDDKTIKGLNDNPDNIMETALQLEEPGTLIITAKGVFQRPDTGVELQNLNDATALFQKLTINTASHELRSGAPTYAGDYLNTNLIAVEHLQGGGKYAISWSAYKGSISTPDLNAMASQCILFIEFIPDSIGAYYPEADKDQTVSSEKISILKNTNDRGFKSGSRIIINNISFSSPEEGYCVINGSGEFCSGPREGVTTRLNDNSIEQNRSNKVLSINSLFNQDVYGFYINVSPYSTHNLEWWYDYDSLMQSKESTMVVKFYPKNMTKNAP